MVHLPSRPASLQPCSLADIPGIFRPMLIRLNRAVLRGELQSLPSGSDSASSFGSSLVPSPRKGRGLDILSCGDIESNPGPLPYVRNTLVDSPFVHFISYSQQQKEGNYPACVGYPRPLTPHTPAPFLAGRGGELLSMGDIEANPGPGAAPCGENVVREVHSLAERALLSNHLLIEVWDAPSGPASAAHYLNSPKIPPRGGHFV